MDSSLEWAIVLASIGEVLLLLVIIVFYRRLRSYKTMIASLQDRQKGFLARLEQSSRLEKEMLDSFEDRRQELARLDALLEARSKKLQQLLEAAQGLSRSPAFLRQTILAGHEKGRSLGELSKTTGLSREEVELIVDQAGSGR